MSRKFTTREKILLLLCSVMFLGIFYYQVVWKSTSKTIESYNTITLEDELLAIQTKAQRMLQMEKIIEKHKGQVNGLVADYNNLENEIIELNKVLKEARSYQLDFEDPTTDGSIVRRNINITFQAKSYEAGKKIIQSLQDFRYKCLLRDINISALEDSLQTTKQVNVSLKATFYEGITDSVSKAGLKTYIDESEGTN